MCRSPWACRLGACRSRLGGPAVTAGTEHRSRGSERRDHYTEWASGDGGWASGGKDCYWRVSVGSCWGAGFERKEALSKAIGGRSQSGGHGSLCWNIEPSHLHSPGHQHPQPHLPKQEPQHLTAVAKNCCKGKGAARIHFYRHLK